MPLDDLSLTAVVTFTPAPNVSDDIALPTLTVRGLRLDGLSRERLLHEVEQHLSPIFSTRVVAHMEEEQYRDSVPVLSVTSSDEIVAMGSVQVTRDASGP